MTIAPGTILISAESLEDPHFKKVVVMICISNQQGATGFVINQLFSRKFNELVAYKQSKPCALFKGGPVDEEQLFFLHRRADIIAAGTPVADSIYLGGNFEQAVACIDHSANPEKDIKLFIGYCGWDANQLEAEIAEGSWLPVTVAATIVFERDAALLWEELYRARVAKFGEPL